jgi:hypothetical protein
MVDGMVVAYHPVSTGGHGEISFSHTINLPAPTAVIAEISLSLFDTASASFGTPVTAFAAFVACTTDGSNPPLPPSETFAFSGGSLSGHPRSVVIRNGLKSITYEIDVVNASADFVVTLFLVPAVVRGNL